MAPVALNIVPGLRAWRQAGITHLLLDEDVAVELRRTAATAPQRRRAHAAPARPSGPAAPAGQARASAPSAPATPAGQARTSAPSGPVAPAGQAHAPQRPATPPPRPTPAAAVPAPATPPAGGQPLYPPHEWPEHWQTLLRSTPPTPMAVWTYPELGTDLRGQASPARRQILKNLLSALRMPTGSNAFWPYALPPEDTPNPSLFAAALEHLKPRTVLLLGEQAVSDLAPLGDLPTVLVRPVLCRGYRFILLPDMETLTALTAPRWDRLIAFVRASLS